MSLAKSTASQTSPPPVTPNSNSGRSTTQLKMLTQHWKTVHPYNAKTKAETHVRFAISESQTKLSPRNNYKSKAKTITSTQKANTTSQFREKNGNSKHVVKKCCSGSTTRIGEISPDSSQPEEHQHKSRKRRSNSKSSGKKLKTKTSKSRSKRGISDPSKIGNSKSQTLVETKSVNFNSSESKEEASNLTESKTSAILKKKSSSVKSKKTSGDLIKSYVKLSRTDKDRDLENYKAAKRRVSRREYYGSLINERFKEWKKEQDERLNNKIAHEKSLYGGTSEDIEEAFELHNIPTEQFIEANQSLPQNTPYQPETKNLIYPEPGRKRDVSLKNENRSTAAAHGNLSQASRNLSVAKVKSTTKPEQKVIQTKPVHKREHSNAGIGERSRIDNKKQSPHKNPMPIKTKQNINTPTSGTIKPVLDRTGSKTLSFRTRLSKEIVSIQGANASNNKSLVSKIKSVFTKNPESDPQFKK